MSDKSIEIIINEMIAKVRNLGAIPVKLKLTQYHYQELSIKFLEHETESFEVSGDSIIYHEKSKRIENYLGIPLEVGGETRLIFSHEV